jgi:hypothetical protein
MSLPDPTASLTPPRNWWQRNWKWAGPVSVLALVAVLMVAIVALVFTMIRQQDVYREAVTRAEASPAVQAELGSPIHEGWWVMGHVRTRVSSGSADLWVPLKGPKKNGTLHASARLSDGHWTYHRMEVSVEGRPARISLLVGEAPF